MAIYLGNLTVRDIEQRLGITLPVGDAQTLSNCRQDNAKVSDASKWHCFDIPFTIVCGSMETAVKVRDILAPHADKMKCPLQISIEG